jgi:hypothetical protein
LIAATVTRSCNLQLAPAGAQNPLPPRKEQPFDRRTRCVVHQVRGVHIWVEVHPRARHGLPSALHALCYQTGNACPCTSSLHSCDKRGRRTTPVRHLAPWRLRHIIGRPWGAQHARVRCCCCCQERLRVAWGRAAERCADARLLVCGAGSGSLLRTAGTAGRLNMRLAADRCALPAKPVDYQRLHKHRRAACVRVGAQAAVLQRPWAIGAGLLPAAAVTHGATRQRGCVAVHCRRTRR